jgi:putative membrane protein
MKLSFSLILKGAAMGVAEVIPGVSGGTIAFITGIYEELIETIKGLHPSKLSLLFKGDLASFWKAINGNFIITLLFGMLIGIIGGVFLITHLVEHYPEILWGFFFGLILASSVYIYQIMPRKAVVEFVVIVVGLVIAYMITSFSPAEGSTSYPFVFLSGMIAVSALLLPGISGSFILLLMGMYVLIIPEIKYLITDFNQDSFLLILVFVLGCITGLVLFSRILSYAFKKFKSATFALLCGFMLGSLNKIWPWREATLWVSESGEKFNAPAQFSGDMEELKVLQEIKVWPTQYEGEPYIFWTVLAFIVGIVIVALLTMNSQPPLKATDEAL